MLRTIQRPSHPLSVEAWSTRWKKSSGKNHKWRRRFRSLQTVFYQNLLQSHQEKSSKPNALAVSVAIVEIKNTEIYQKSSVKSADDLAALQSFSNADSSLMTQSFKSSSPSSRSCSKSPGSDRQWHHACHTMEKLKETYVMSHRFRMVVDRCNYRLAETSKTDDKPTLNYIPKM